MSSDLKFWLRGSKGNSQLMTSRSLFVTPHSTKEERIRASRACQMSSPTKQSDSIVPAANAGATSARPQERRIVGVPNTAKSQQQQQQQQQQQLLQQNDDQKQKVLTNDVKGAASALLRKGPGGQAAKKEKPPTTQSLGKENSDTIRKSASSKEFKVSVPPSQTGGSVVPTTQPRPSHGSLGRQRIGPIVVGAMVPRPMVIPTGKQTSARHAAPPASAVAPKKKRKLPPPKVSRPNPLPLSPSMPLADPFIVKTVHDIIGLLETCELAACSFMQIVVATNKFPFRWPPHS